MTQTKLFETPACFARDDTAGAGLGQRKKTVVDGRAICGEFMRSIRRMAQSRNKEAPGIPWAAVARNGELRFTIGEDADDDRYIHRYIPRMVFRRRRVSGIYGFIPQP